jgi:hypothetical protein
VPPVTQGYVLPGTGWVCEQRGADGVLSVIPLVGWFVDHNHECHPLPRSLGTEWLAPLPHGVGPTMNKRDSYYR